MRTPHGEVGRQIAGELGVRPEAGEVAIQIMAMVARLERVPLTNQQKTAAATVGGALRHFDDAYDRFDIRHSQALSDDLSRAITHGTDNQSNMSGQLQRAIQIARDSFTPEAHAALIALAQAQTDSILQRGERIEIDTLVDITRRKGANSVLIFALEMNPHMDENRRKCYEELGYLVQLLDDYLDRDADRRSRIHTLATDLAPTDIEVRIKNQVRTVKSLFTSEYPEDHELTELFAYIDTQVHKTGIAYR